MFKSGVLSTNDNSDKYYKSKILGFIIDTHHFDLTGEYRTASCCYNKQPFAPIEYYYSFKKKNQINERFDETNHSIKDTTTNNSSTYSIVEEMPIFPGGEIELFKFLSKNLKAPNTLERGGIVYVTFVINKQGLIEQPKILRGLTDECDTEVLRVLNLMPKWLPGKQRGVPVKVQYNLPIRFSPSMK